MNYFFSSYKRLAVLLFTAAIILSIPLTLSLLSQQQDVRQRAQLTQIQECVEGTCGSLDTGSGSPSGLEQNFPATQVYCTAIGAYTTREICAAAASRAGSGSTTTPAPAARVANVTTNCSVSDADLAMDSSEQEMLNLINQYRQQNGLSPLSVSLALTRTAAWMAKDMATSGNVNGHTDSLGRLYGARSGDCGYQESSTVAENVFGGSISDEVTALNAWKNSPGHNMTILNKVGNANGGAPIPREWKAIGIARAGGGASPFIYRWVTEFGLVSDGGTLPTVTISPTVTINPTSGPTAPPTTITPTGTILSGPGDLSISIKLKGIGSDTKSGENTSPVTTNVPGQIQLINPQTKQIVSEHSASFSFQNSNLTYKTIISQVTAGVYNVKVKLDNSLWKEGGNVQVGANGASLQNILLSSGDLNQDNKLDISDYNIFLGCYGSNQCAQKTQADLNMDGTVEERDLNIFYSGLAKRSGD